MCTNKVAFCFLFFHLQFIILCEHPFLLNKLIIQFECYAKNESTFFDKSAGYVAYFKAVMMQGFVNCILPVHWLFPCPTIRCNFHEKSCVYVNLSFLKCFKISWSTLLVRWDDMTWFCWDFEKECSKNEDTRINKSKDTFTSS